MVLQMTRSCYHNSSLSNKTIPIALHTIAAKALNHPSTTPNNNSCSIIQQQIACIRLPVTVLTALRSKLTFVSGESNLFLFGNFQSILICTKLQHMITMIEKSVAIGNELIKYCNCNDSNEINLALLVDNTKQLAKISIKDYEEVTYNAYNTITYSCSTRYETSEPTSSTAELAELYDKENELIIAFFVKCHQLAIETFGTAYVQGSALFQMHESILEQLYHFTRYLLPQLLKELEWRLELHTGGKNKLGATNWPNVNLVANMYSTKNNSNITSYIKQLYGNEQERNQCEEVSSGIQVTTLHQTTSTKVERILWEKNDFVLKTTIPFICHETAYLNKLQGVCS